ncbi:hypothetical protein B0I33_103320 [Prauserella shujinwangii]|uniref:DUF4352 domain-containing protein n=1 Tax=Prauserella shujinwangii TaxID=1453103 RepID=A0A2T0LYT5_9PSEU|nr:hypothetical protein [Prauserella shujinwangii]PRX49286.1 hypothetical protein B0I33_103320 [Prauserella shujinwangii]
MRRTPRAVLAVCALLAAAGCGQQAAGDESDIRSSAPPPSTTVYAATPSGTIAEFGSDYRFTSGLVVTVSPPKSFQPSPSAYPQSERAAAFGIAVYNRGEQPYRLSKLSVTATIDDQATKQVVDATQGYNGIVDADQDVLPGQTVRLTLAFAVPAEPTRMRLSLRPDSAASRTAVYSGSV